MKFFAFCLLLSLPLMFSACAPGQVSTTPPSVEAPPIQTAPPVVEPPPPAVMPEPIPPTTTTTTVNSDSISEKHLQKALEQKNLLQVIREVGVPDDNLTPGRREQIAVYQLEGKYQFYLFRDSRLVATGEYPRSLIEQMQQRGTYPRDVIQDFARLAQ